MRKLILTVVALMCSGLWAVAQNTSPDTNQASPNGQTAGAPSSASASGSSTTTIDGCLSGSAGSYMLRDKATGTTYNLTGSDAKLNAHVGHEIQVTGSASPSSSASSSGSMSGSSSASASSPSSSGSSSGASGSQSFSVSSVKMVSSSCSNQ